MEAPRMSNVYPGLLQLMPRLDPVNTKFEFPNALFVVPVAVSRLLLVVDPRMVVNPGPVAPLGPVTVDCAPVGPVAPLGPALFMM